MTTDHGSRTYRRSECVVFRKTTEAFGGLSNMAAGFPLVVNGIRIRTVEALYQACRFPHRPEVQRMVLAEASPMTAKMRTKPFRHDTRRDWDEIRVQLMRWCLRVKLLQHPETFGSLLLQSGEGPIVEESRRDAFWGAKPAGDDTLVGLNVLGRLLRQLREEWRERGGEPLANVEPLSISEFLLDGRPIGTVVSPDVVALPSDIARVPAPMPEQIPLL